MMDDSTISIDGRPPPLRGELTPGDRIDRYVIIARLGAGGMGVVWEASDSELDRRVAIKLVRSVISRNGQQRLLREAQAMAKLSHPAVVPVFDIGTIDDQLYIVMELVDGSTLADTLRERTRPWREILDVFMRCGRGLAAAHAAGIIHRDFKPDNVLVSRDGRARITDFGLARLDRAVEDTTAAGSGAPPHPLTGDGAVLGTPRYMAPEQKYGEATPRSDQYSFCVALWEALYGRPPAGEAPLVAPTRTRVPSAIRDVLVRGLAEDPEARWPSMMVLLDALERVPVRRRRIAIAAVAMTAAGAVAVAVGAVGGHLAPSRDACTGFAAQLADVWNPRISDQVVTAFGELTPPRAAETARRAAAILDERARDWITARVTVCRAATRREVTPEVAEVRIACLERRRDELSALVRVLAAPDDKIVPRAISAADDTGRVGGCLRELASHEDGVPDDPKLAAVRAKLADALAFRKLGRVSDAVGSLSATADAALEIGARSLAGRALLELAIAQTSTSPDDAEATLRRATRIAGEAHDDALVARCLIYTIFLTGYVRKHVDEALALRPITEATIGRAGEAPALQYGLHHNVGQVLSIADRADAAQEELQMALAIEESAPEPDVTSLFSTLNALGNVTEERGDYASSRRLFERAVTLIERRDGADAPLLGYPINNLGMIAYREGRHEDALALYRRAYRLFEANLPPTSPQLAAAALNVAEELRLTGRLDEAGPLYQRSLESREAAFGADHPDVAQTLVNYAMYHAAAGRVAEGRAMLERAVAIRRKKLGPDHILLASALANLALLEADAGAAREAESSATEALAIFDRTDRREHPEVIESLIALGRARLARAAPRSAVSVLERALGLQPKPRPELWGTATFLLARALWDSGGDKARARALARDAHAALVSAGTAARPWTQRAAEWLTEHSRPADPR